jgi:phosphoribosylanthranilate isomerase
MREATNIMEVAMLTPNYMGFIFYEKSKRFVGNNFSLPTEFPEAIKRVGVFVNEKVQRIQELALKNKLDYVQLHGNESLDICRRLKKKKVGVIKVFSVDESFDFETTKPYHEFSDFFLFDTKTEGYGGSGKTFSWNLLTRYDQQTPFFLSGGLSTENIGTMNELQGMNVHAIDVNSGVEVKPGLKSVVKIKSVMNILNSISNKTFSK